MYAKFYAKSLINIIQSNISLLREDVANFVLPQKPHWIRFRASAAYHYKNRELGYLTGKIKRLENYSLFLKESIIHSGNEDYIVKISNDEFQYLISGIDRARICY